MSIFNTQGVTDPLTEELSRNETRLTNARAESGRKEVPKAGPCESVILMKLETLPTPWFDDVGKNN